MRVISQRPPAPITSIPPCTLSSADCAENIPLSSPTSSLSHGSLGLARVRSLRCVPYSLDPRLTPPLRVYIAFYYAFRTLVPQPHNRTPWSWSNAYWALLPFLPLGFMAYLVRRRDTFVIRLLMLPSVVFLSVRSAYGCVYSTKLRNPWLRHCGGLQLLLAPTVAPGV